MKVKRTSSLCERERSSRGETRPATTRAALLALSVKRPGSSLLCLFVWIVPFSIANPFPGKVSSDRVIRLPGAPLLGTVAPSDPDSPQCDDTLRRLVTRKKGGVSVRSTRHDIVSIVCSSLMSSSRRRSGRARPK